jgi:hypothetical protein
MSKQLKAGILIFFLAIIWFELDRWNMKTVENEIFMMEVIVFLVLKENTIVMLTLPNIIYSHVFSTHVSSILLHNEI